MGAGPPIPVVPPELVAAAAVLGVLVRDLGTQVQRLQSKVEDVSRLTAVSAGTSTGTTRTIPEREPFGPKLGSKRSAAAVLVEDDDQPLPLALKRPVPKKPSLAPLPKTPPRVLQKSPTTPEPTVLLTAEALQAMMAEIVPKATFS